MMYNLEDITSPDEIFNNPLYCFGDALLLYVYEDIPHTFAKTLYPAVYKELCDEKILIHAVKKDLTNISFVHYRDIRKPIIKKNWLSIARKHKSNYGNSSDERIYIDSNEISLCIDMRDFIISREDRIKEVFGDIRVMDYINPYEFLYDRVLIEDEYIAIYNGNI